jgi:hypothetical protein
MKLLMAIWENAYGLLVDDGRLAGGAVLGLIVTGLLAVFGPNDTIQQVAGPLLLVWVCVLLLSNLYAAGKKAKG